MQNVNAGQKRRNRLKIMHSGRLQQTDAFLSTVYTSALVPSILAIMGNYINIIVDGILVGRKIGEDGLAAISLSVPVNLIISIFGSFFVTGAAISAAREVGKRNTGRAQRFYGSALSICLILAIVFALVGVFAAGKITELLITDQTLEDYVRQYVTVTVIGAAPMLFIYIPFHFLRIDGKNRACMAMMLCMAVTDIFMNIFFLYVLKMGVRGSALATVLANTAACLVGFIALHTGESTFAMHLSLPDRQMAKSMGIAGSPAAINNLMQTIRVSFINSLFLLDGGARAVAVYAVVNGISALSESITLGVPQAGQAIIGVCQGEHDVQSQRILLNQEFVAGISFAIIYGLVIVIGNKPIAGLYNINEPLLFPFCMLALSVIPAVYNNILSTYYTISGHGILSNGIIICKNFLFSVLFLYILIKLDGPAWAFLPLSEGTTLAILLLLTGFLLPRMKPGTDEILLTRQEDEEDQVVSFSMAGIAEDAGLTSQKISEFCRENGMDRGLGQKISLTLEEFFVYIIQENPTEIVNFDIRIFHTAGGIGIRIRYNGKKLNPFEEDAGKMTADGENLGIHIIEGLAREVSFEPVFGVNAVTMIL